jgi:HNH endonuclease.
MRVYSSDYYYKNPEKSARKQAESFQRNKKKRAAYRKEKNRTDLNSRIAKNLRTRMWDAIKDGPKVGSAVGGLCCSIDEFKAKIAKFFEPGMTWDDTWGNGPGKWHLDHIIPLSWFDLTNEEQFQSAAHYSNYQPLWAHDNLSKSDKSPEEWAIAKRKG